MSFWRCEITDSFVCSSALDDLLVVVEQVPDPLGGVDDVVEVELELLGQEALRRCRSSTRRVGALGLDDLAVRDDLLLHVRDVADDLLGAALEHLVLDRVELVADLVEDREAVVEEVVEDVVEQVARALREEAASRSSSSSLAAGEEPRDRQQLDVRQRDQEVRCRGRRRARPRSAAGSPCRRRGSGGRRTGTPGTRRSSAAGASRGRPRGRAGASRSARRAAPPRPPVGESRWTQVRPWAESSASRGSARRRRPRSRRARRVSA